MRLNYVQLIFLGGIIAAIAIASVCEGVVRRAAALLDAQTRDRVWRREAAYVWWWRIPDTLGIILIVLGIAKILVIQSSVPWGYPVMAIGLALVCTASALRACLTRRCYALEAPGSPASRNALAAAVLVSFTELLLAAGVCWFIFSTPIVARTSKPALATAPKPTLNPETGAVLTTDWVSEDEGVALLKGKDARYFRALAKYDDFRTKKDGGQVLYLRDDIVKRKEAGLPTEEELKKVLKDLGPASEEPVLQE